jgi:hypothetical protein
MQSRPAVHDNGQVAEVLARQGMRLPQIVLKRLRDAGIYCQPTLSIEYQNAAKKHVLRGVESGAQSPVWAPMQVSWASAESLWPGSSGWTALQ